jgi:hypothetical protein
MGERVFKGRTEDAEAPFLSAEFWKQGVKVSGVVDRVFEIEHRKNYALTLVKSVDLDGEPYDIVSIGESAGLRMAMQAARVRQLLEGDKVVVECTGTTAPKKAGNSPRVNFAIEVTRPDSDEPSPY